MDAPRRGHRRCNLKGSGYYLGSKIKQLSEMHLRVLRILFKGPHTKQETTQVLNEEAKKSGGVLTGGFSISGRLSELLGAGYVAMEYSEVQVWDPRAMQFRFKKKPLWSLTEKGKRALE